LKKMKHNKISFDRDLIERCQTNAPRYTSYPTADKFNFDFTRKVQIEHIKSEFTSKQQDPISLYIHIPFCNTLCLFCACNKIITNDRNKITAYLTYLEREIELYYKLIGRKLDVIQLHFGGGSPSWLSITELNQVMTLINKYFNLDHAREIAMELDPRHVTVEFVQALKNNGFNRISIGMQDLDPKVQKAVNRIQPYEQSKMVLDAARDLGFESTNVDLIYGLPLQTLDGFAATIDKTIELKPNRIALFNYAHIPNIFMPQTRIKEEDLPTASEKLDILQMSVNKFADAGYVFIGMDHFALPGDELAVALNNETLQRNFQGYSTFADTNMLAFGVSAIGFVGNSYYQNVKDLTGYYQTIDNAQLPILRGMVLTFDDILRRYVISQIMCQFKLNYETVADKFSIDFAEYFKSEINKLQDLEDLDLISLSGEGFIVTPKGRFLIRNVAVIFDNYYQKTINNKAYSKVI
jgi:oxygen-independent coproporphyrinogen III oxidase